VALYHYRGRCCLGKKKEGTLKAETLALAKDMLIKQKIFVTHLALVTMQPKKLKLSKEMLLHFTAELSQLLKAGLPLYESLVAIEDKYKAHKSHLLFLELCELIKQGKQLSAALACFPETFNRIYISMVASGEEMGGLAHIFSQLSDLITRQEKLKKQLISAMIYPCFLLSFCLVVVAALFFFLIPSMEQLFEGRELHPMTQTVLQTSLFLRKHSLELAGCSFVFLGFAVYASFSSAMQENVKGLMLRIPFLKKFITQSVLARFARALCVMLGSSVTLLEALKLAKQIMNQPQFEQIITRCENYILQGGKLSHQLEQELLIPRLVVRMIAIAEQSGNLAEMLRNISEIYEQELDKSLTRFTTMLQPVMLVILAIIVGVVILSILLPLTDVGSFLTV
jgi:general secretion pathway protein F